MTDKERAMNVKEILKRNLKDMNKISIGDMVVLKCFVDATFEYTVESSEYGDELKDDYEELSKKLKPNFKKTMSIHTEKVGYADGVH